MAAELLVQKKGKMQKEHLLDTTWKSQRVIDQKGAHL